MNWVRRALVVGAFALTTWAGGTTADARNGPDEAPGCIPGTSGFVVRLCLSTPPPLGPARPGPATTATTTSRAGDGLLLESVRVAGTDMRLESRIGDPDRAAIVAAAAGDVPAVESDYGRAFAERPVIQVFATVASFEYAMQVLFGYPASTARQFSAAGGALDRASRGIAINWQRVSHERPITILRHELSHLMVQQIVGPNEVPAWFDEGLATLAQRALGTAVDDDYLAAALLEGRMLSLAQLVTAESWLRSSAALGTGAYAVAGAVTETVRQDVGREGLVRILELTARGQAFDDAFAAVARQSPPVFAETVAARIGQRSPALIVLTPLTDARGDLVFTARGFPASATVEIAIEGTALDGRPYRLVYDARTDATGVIRGSFGSTAPAGSYALRVRAQGRSATAIMRTAGPP